MNKQTFEVLNTQIQKCKKCDLCDLLVNQKDLEKGYGKLLGWRGSEKDSKYFFVGMNPSHVRFSKLEYAFGGPIGDNQGIGKRFLDMLKRISVFDEIYCTNLVKCSSLDNDINLQCTSSCIIHFSEELDIIKPKVVIAFGKQVYDVINSFFKNYNINIKLYQTWHPSWIYRYKKVTEEKYSEIIEKFCKEK